MSRRKLDIDGDIWRYQVGSRYVKIRAPDGKAHYISKDKLVGNTIDRQSDPLVEMPPNVGLTPSAIKKYVEVVLIKGERWFPHKHLTGKLIREYKYLSKPNVVEVAG